MWSSAETRARYEPLLLAGLILLGAVGARYLQAESSTYTPQDLRNFGRVSGISVEGWPEHPFFLNWVGGDGQVFAAFAADPLHGGNRVRIPEYRFTRVGYSWAVAAVTLGQDQWVPYGLVLVNAAAVIYVAHFAARKREAFGPRIWWLVANPALYLGFWGDTAEPLGIALLVAALSSGSVAAAIFLAAVRPSFLVGVVHRPRLLLAGGVTALAIRGFAVWLFDGSPTMGTYNLAWPLVGYIEVPSMPGVLVALAGMLTLALGLLRRRPAWMFSGLLVLMFGPLLLGSGVINAVRAAGLLPVLWALDPLAQSSANKKDPSKRVLLR